MIRLVAMLDAPGCPVYMKKTMKTNFLFFNFNEKSNKHPLRFTFSSMVEGSRKVKKIEYCTEAQVLD